MNEYVSEGARSLRIMGAAVLLLLLLASGIGIACDAGGGDDGYSALPPELAQDFTLPLLGGGEITLSELRGQPVVIDFWATWCLPCIKQVPLFNAFHEEHGDKVRFFAIATDADGAAAVEPFAAEHQIEYPVLLGDEEMAQSWGLIGYPTLFVINPDGEIQEAHVGPLLERDLEEAVSGWVE